MAIVSRRTVGLLAGSAAASLAMPAYLKAQARPQVLVIGGGAGGATAARYIANDSRGAIEVTLIEEQETFTSCFFSNHYLGGFRSFDSITHRYDRLQAVEAITKITARATAIDRDRKRVALGDGTTLGYDRLVVSPGIDLIWDSVPGYSQDAAEAAPHAWKAGRQTRLLHDKLHALKDGENIVMVPPPDPYRCPPAPYERASMMAHVLKSKGFTNSKIFILDPKDKFSKQALFFEGWESRYPGMIVWIAPDIHGGVTNVDVETGTVETDLDTFEGALLNIIPAQKAGEITQAADLADHTGFCPIDGASMRSTADTNVFVLGDAAIAGDMPKSAFAANSQAKVAAMAVVADLLGSTMPPAHYANACWSLIDADDAVKVGGQYEPVDGRIAVVSSFISQPGEAATVREAAYEESLAWYAGITADIFGG